MLFDRLLQGIQGAAKKEKEIDDMDAYIALDLETTGLSPKSDRILEIGAARVVNGVVVDSYSTLIDPERVIPGRITELTGITQDMVKGMPKIKDAVPGLVAFCGELPLLGHNIMFDYSFIKHSAVNNGFTFEKEGIDTLKISRALLADLPSRSLQSLRLHYEIPQENVHRALDDALTAHLLYRRLKSEYGEENSELFAPKILNYKVKKQGPATPAQKRHLQELVKYHRIELSTEVESLTKNEASRLIDTILGSYGKIMR